MRLRVPFLGAVLSLVLSSGSAAQDADPQLLARFCGAVVQNADHAALVGRVRDAETGHGLAGVTVVARWEELGVDRTTGSATKTPHTLAAVSDSEAVYRFCAVPRYTPLALRAQAADRMSGAIEIQIAAQPIFVRGISFSLGAAFVNGSGTATLVGEIVSGVGQPVRQARVTLDGAIGEATDNLKMESTLDIVRPHEIKAIEIYLGAGTVPPEYNDPCGAIVIWTK